MSDIIVTIRCITYNHEPYIRECLEGFVMQQTNFKFEAIVHDDASTDGTAAIIAEFAKKYPDIIIPLYETENQFSKKDGSLDRIMNAHLRGKYIAICEGDDYWTDPHKLQKQVDFLEANPEYSMCFHNVEVIGDINVDINLFNHLETKTYSGNEIIERWTVPTCSSLLRREVIFNVPTHEKFVVGDNVLFATAARYGKLYCDNCKMATYRRNPDGITLKGVVRSKELDHYKALREVFLELEDSTKIVIARHYFEYFIKNLKRLNILFVRNFIDACNDVGTCYFLRCFMRNLYALLRYKLLPKKNKYSEV